MNCPSCGAELDEKLVDLHTGMVRCPSCGRETEVLFSHDEKPVEPPDNTRVVIDRSRPGEIALYVPGKGGGFFLAFGVLWVLIVSVMLVGAMTSGSLLSLFLVLFWLLGFGFLAMGLFMRFGVTGIYIDREQFILTKKLFNKGWTRRGPTEAITAIKLVEVFKKNNQPVMAAHIVTAANSYGFGSFLTDEEKNWIVGELRQFVAKIGHPVGPLHHPH